ncbi:hypothetical protein [Lactiplantibacillus pentosus]|nr:hypothetical protein [Lactiplantibacillus pentosus]
MAETCQFLGQKLPAETAGNSASYRKLAVVALPYAVFQAFWAIA